MRILKGKPGSKGFALGKVYIYKAFKADVHESYFESGKEDLYFQKYQAAVKTARAELESIVSSMEVERPKKAKIFSAQIEILTDEEVEEGVKKMICESRAMPDYAVDEVYTGFANLLEKAKDPQIADRVADIRDVRNRVLRILGGEHERNLSGLRENVIVVAHDLLPSDTATMNRERVMGIVTETGGATSHTAILARGYRIPAVLGVSDATEIMKSGDNVILDALNGLVLLEPEKAKIQEYQEKLIDYIKEETETSEFLDKIPMLASGERYSVGLNIDGTDPDVNAQYVDFVGLFRTEFLFMGSEQLPTEQEQFEAYKRVLANAMGRPVTLRTFDIGGDKTLPSLPLPKEENPFLGNRALRLCLTHPDLFKTQLRAALRASAFGPLQIMFPMVGTMDDLRAAKLVLEEAKAELRAEGKPFDEKTPFGIMIEIPSIALIADMVALEVDFASVGTNDLTQYLHAVDRMNPALSDYFQSMSPAMLRILGHIFNEFNKAGKAISVCGELAGDTIGALLMFGLGLRKFSMNGANIGRVKRTLSLITLDEVQEIAKKALELSSEAEIIAFVSAEIEKRS